MGVWLELAWVLATVAPGGGGEVGCGYDGGCCVSRAFQASHLVLRSILFYFDI